MQWLEDDHSLVRAGHSNAAGHQNVSALVIRQKNWPRARFDRRGSTGSELGDDMKLIVTGANGFIGQHLVSRLSARHEIFAPMREPNIATACEAVSTIEWDLAGQLNVRTLPETIDVIVHLAQANVPFPEAANELFAVNTIATQQLLDYARRAGARQFILASTGDVYGRRRGLSTETDAAQPADYYAVTKYAAELVAQAYSGFLNPCIMRLYQPYGPGQSGRLVPKLAELIRRREAVRLHKGDRPRLTPLYVDDVTCAIERAIDCCYAGVVNIAGNRIISMRELAEAIGQTLETEPVFEETGEDSADLMGGNGLMKQVLGSWNMMSLADGLSRTFNGEEAIAWQVDD